MDLGFDDILPHLAASYRRGLLTPFLGSGMSVPVCTSWTNFLVALATAAGFTVPEQIVKQQATGDLVRVADKAVLGLSSMPIDERARIYQNALNAGGKPAGSYSVTPQTAALALSTWPLVLTTNYDDLYVTAQEKGDVPEVLGRSVADCHKVLRSLDASTRPILWALQGFVGGQAREPSAIVPDVGRRRELASQLVVGHQQYQNAINSQPHFRRAFAEVLSRRSLLFIGSGILEDYLVNLFGEIAYHYGPGPYPHFALFSSDKKATLDTKFLQARLGIAPVFYGHYSELPALLERLAKVCRTSWAPSELTFKRDATTVRIANEMLAPPASSSECVLVSVGRNPDNTAREGSQAKQLFADAGLKGSLQALDAAPSYAFRLPGSAIFAVAARVPNPSADAIDAAAGDARDLGVIEHAIKEALKHVSKAGYERVHIGPVASGKHRLWHPIHPFVETIAAVRRFMAETPDSSIRAFDIHVYEDLVWSPIVAGKIPVLEILASDVMKVLVEVRDASGGSDIMALTARGPIKVSAIKELCGLVPDRWDTEIFPRPGAMQPSSADDLLVTPNAIVVFSPRR